MRYYDIIRNTSSNVNMQSIISACNDALPPNLPCKPYYHPELQNGTALLSSEDALNAYMVSYGEMHTMKCRAALQNFPYNEITGKVEIVDWGCGQGIGSLCVIEALQQHDLLQWLERVALIEPSNAARERAIFNVRHVLKGSSTNIVQSHKYLPGNGEQDEIIGIKYVARNVIHVFSNILDIPSIDLKKLANIVAVNGHKHFILCVGPLNPNSYRVDEFCKIFGEQLYFSNISDKHYSRTSNTYHEYTCKTKCFLYNTTPLIEYTPQPQHHESLQPIYSEYDPRFALINGSISQGLCQLYEIFERILHPTDIIILQPDINGDKPDLVIVRPHKGILIVNICEKKFTSEYELVKYKEKENVVETFQSKTDEVLSPFSVIDTYQRNLIRLHVDTLLDKVLVNKKNWHLIKKMIVFTQYTSKEAWGKFKDASTNHTSIWGRDLLDNKTLQDNLFHSLSFTANNSDFDDGTMRQFLRLLSPQWHSYNEGSPFKLTTIQRNLAISKENSQQKISGTAGAGKTQVLATRAINAQVRTGGNVLVLMFNIALTNYMKFRLGQVQADFPWSKITIDYYHHFFRTQANNCNLHISFNSYEAEDFFKGSEHKIRKYDAIFIDEVQDYKSEWLHLLYRYFLKENGEFVVFGDPKQNIYNRELDRDGNVRLRFVAGSWNNQLSKSHRFANAQLANLSYQYQLNFVPQQVDPSSENLENILQSSLDTFIKYWRLKKDTPPKTLASNCRWIINEYHLDPRDVVILSNTRGMLRGIDYHYRKETKLETLCDFSSLEKWYELLKIHHLSAQEARTNNLFNNDHEALCKHKKVAFTMDSACLKLSTIHSYKGWEAPSVILIIEPEMKGNLDDVALIYTAITRARSNLFVLNLGNMKYDNFFMQHTQR